MVTLVPGPPLVGVKLLIVGVNTTVKLDPLVAVPLGVVTEMVPVVAPAGTVAEICVAEFTVNDAEVPLNLTEVAPVKFDPVMVTLAPIGPLVGLKLVIVGELLIVNVPELVAVPPHVVTEICPVVAAAGTVAVIEDEEFTV
jgi:hypothetical protein